MIRPSRLATLFMLGALAAGTAFAEDKPAATVNGVAIPQARLDMYVNATIAKGQQKDTPELRKAILDKLIDLEVLSQEALKNGLNKQTETQQQIELSKQNVLAGALVQEQTKIKPVTEDDLKQEYDDLKKGLGSKEYDVRHILVDKESDAKAIYAKLKKGGKDGNFDKLAKAKSTDSGSKDHGGDLGWVPAGSISSTYVKPFADAVLAMSKGQISEPVKSQFGWHIIKLEDVRDVKIPPLDEIKPQLTNRLQQQAIKKFIDDLHSKAKIE